MLIGAVHDLAVLTANNSQEVPISGTRPPPPKAKGAGFSEPTAANPHVDLLAVLLWRGYARLQASDPPRCSGRSREGADQETASALGTMWLRRLTRDVRALT
jgi:hypothetical protein